jgi:hypothetical protein
MPRNITRFCRDIGHTKRCRRQYYTVILHAAPHRPTGLRRCCVSRWASWCLPRCARGPSATGAARPAWAGGGGGGGGVGSKARLTGGPCLPYIQNAPTAQWTSNNALRKPLRPARKRTGGRSRGGCMEHLVPHGISGPKSARPSPGAEHAERPTGQWVLSGPRTYVINKAMRPAMHETCACHCRLQAQDFFALQRQPLLFSHNRNALLCTRHCLLLVAVIVDLLLWC